MGGRSRHACDRPVLSQVCVTGHPTPDQCDADVQELHAGVVPIPLLRAHYFFGHPFRKLYTASGLNHSWAFIASYLANALLHSPGALPTADKHSSASHARRASPVRTCACDRGVTTACANTVSTDATNIILILFMFSPPFVSRFYFSDLRASSWS